MNLPTTSKTFEERMFEQMKSQMGELLSLEEFKSILETSIQKAFFEPRRTYKNYGSETQEPLFVELVRKELAPLMEAAAKQWLSENQDKVGEILKSEIGSNAAEFVANAFKNMMSIPMQQFSFELQNKLGANGIHF